MINIAICGDEKSGNDLKQILSRYIRDRGIGFEITTFECSREFVKQGIEMLKYKIVFLNINKDEDESNALMAAKYIRENNRDIFIVFIAEYANYAVEGYKVDAVRYILKNDINVEANIYECMDAIREKIEYKIICKEFRFKEGLKKVSLDNILYIESKLHKLEFCIMEDCLKKYSLRGTLNQMEENLSKYGFLRIHQSFLINMKFVKSIYRYTVLLNNGIQLGISRARYRQVEDRFASYKGKI